jgi:hypothetical protein
LWLVGIGAFILVAAGGWASPALRLHLEFAGSGDSRRERMAFAGTIVGGLSTAAGSLLVAGSNLPSVWFWLGTIVLMATVGYVLLAWKVHALWTARRYDAAMVLRTNQDSRREVWLIDAASLCARWRWALGHPLTPADASWWPVLYLVRRLGDCPPGPLGGVDLNDMDAVKLRQVLPNVARLDAADVPPWLLDVVLVARDCDCEVLRSGRYLGFYTLGGEYASASIVKPKGAAFAHRQLVRSLSKLGLPTHRGTWGQLVPGRDRSHLRAVLKAYDQARQLTGASASA